jgi:hypothetical protein
MGHTPTSEGGDNPTTLVTSDTSISEGETLTTTVTTLNQATKKYITHLKELESLMLISLLAC